MSVEDVVEIVRQRIKEVDPNILTHEGTSIHDALIKPGRYFLQPLADAIEAIRNSLRVTEYEGMDQEDLESLIFNFFVNYLSGTKSSGVVKIYVLDAVNIEIVTGHVFQDPAGNQYRPIISQKFTKQQVGFNYESPYYYIKLLVLAEEEGVTDAPSGTAINVIGTVPGYVRAEADSDFSLGTSGEDKDAFVNRAKDEIALRDLLTTRGARATILDRERDRFPYISEVFPIGFRDPEMIRDVFNSTTGAVHIGGKTDIYVRTVQSSKETIIAELPENHIVRIKALSIYNDEALEVENAGALTYDLGSGRYLINNTPFSTPSRSFDSLFDSPLTGISVVKDSFNDILNVTANGTQVFNFDNFDIDGTQNVNVLLVRHRTTNEYHTVYTVYDPDTISKPSFIEIVVYIPNVFIAEGAGEDYLWNYPDPENAIIDVPIFRVTRIAVLDPVSLEEEYDMNPNSYKVLPVNPEDRFSVREEAGVHIITTYHGVSGTDYQNRLGGYVNILTYGAGQWEIDQFPLEIGDDHFADQIVWAGQDFENDQVNITGIETVLDFGNDEKNDLWLPDQNFEIPINAFILIDSADNMITGYSILEMSEISIPDTYTLIAYIPNCFEGDGVQYEWTLKHTYSTEGTGIGLPLKIEHESPALDDLQEFISSPDDRITNADFLAKTLTPTFVDVEANFYGDTEVATVEEEITNYVNALKYNRSFKNVDVFLEAGKLVSYLSTKSISVDLPITLRAEEYNYRGEIIFHKSQRKIGINRCGVFVVRTVTATKVEL